MPTNDLNTQRARRRFFARRMVLREGRCNVLTVAPEGLNFCDHSAAAGCHDNLRCPRLLGYGVTVAQVVSESALSRFES